MTLITQREMFMINLDLGFCFGKRTGAEYRPYSFLTKEKSVNTKQGKPHDFLQSHSKYQNKPLQEKCCFRKPFLLKPCVSNG